jgi:hypothetical protein
MTRHQVETELSDIRREITLLQRREVLLIQQAEGQAGAQPSQRPRPGWPMRRETTLPGNLVQIMGARISISEPPRTAV